MIGITKVLHLSHTDISNDARILKEMSSLAESFDDIQVCGIGLLKHNAEPSVSRFGRDDHLSIHGVNVRTRKLRRIPSLCRHALVWLELSLRMLYAGIKLRPKVIHCHDTVILPVGVVIRVICRSVLIYDAHELESKQNGMTPIISQLTLCVEKICWRFIHRLICVGPSIAQWYKRHFKTKDTYIILNAPILSLSKVAYDETYLRREFNIPEERLIFIYVGMFMTGRGIDLIGHVFTDPAIESHVVFLGEGQQRDALTRLAAQHQNIHVHPAVPHQQVIPIAKSADVGLCMIQNNSLSNFYCLPNKLFEYAFSGIPVLASDFPDMREMIEQYQLGQTCEPSVPVLKKAVARMEQQCLLSYSNHPVSLIPLSWQNQADKLTSLYQQILPQHRASISSKSI